MLKFLDKWSPWRLQKRIKTLEHVILTNKRVMMNLASSLADAKNESK